MITKNSNNIDPKRIWNPQQIWIASFLAGPIGGCYLLGKNYAILGNKLNAKRSLIIGIFSTLILFALPVFFQIPKSFRAFIIPMGYTMLIFESARKLQGEQIKELLNSGARRHSYFKLVLFSILFLSLEFIYGFSLGWVLQL